MEKASIYWLSECAVFVLWSSTKFENVSFNGHVSLLPNRKQLDVNQGASFHLRTQNKFELETYGVNMFMQFANIWLSSGVS